MDRSTYNFSGHQDDDSPTLSPLSATFDQYRDFEDPSFFNTLPNGPFSGLSQTAAFSMTPRANIRQTDSGFPLDFQPTDENLYDQYLDDTLRLMSNTSNQVTYPDQLSTGDASPRQQPPSTVDGAMFFLPSPPDANESSCYTSPEALSDRPSEKRKRRSQQAPKTTGKTTQRSPTDDTQPDQRPTTQLRTACRSQKGQPSKANARKLAASAPSEEVRARATHNHVEQQYRKRLNTQFQKLLAVLPQAECEGGDAASDGEDAKGGGVQKRISKAEVLDLARRRIKTLESERAVLERQKRELAGCVGRLQDEWARRLGGEAPIKMEG